MTEVRAATERDAEAVAAIYAPYVSSTAVTFETEILSPDDVVERMRSGAGLYPWFVAEDDQGAVIGYAYAARFRARNAYRFAVETTVYVDPRGHGQGIGRALYSRLLATLAAQGFTQAIAAIALPNQASIRLHEALGFVATGVYHQVGYKLDEWHDVGIWQRALAAPETPPREPKPFDEELYPR